jgi:hypothetical protein
MPQLPFEFPPLHGPHTQLGQSIVPRAPNGESLKAAGCAQVLEAEKLSWLRIAHAALRAFAASEYPREFTIEQLRDSFAKGHLNAPHHPNVWGALTREAIRLGVIRQTGYTKAKSAKTHGHPVGKYRWNPDAARPNPTPVKR